VPWTSAPPVLPRPLHTYGAPVRCCTSTSNPGKLHPVVGWPAHSRSQAVRSCGIEWGLVRVAIDVGSYITDGEAKRFKTTMLQKAQRLSTESVASMSLTKVLGTSSDALMMVVQDADPAAVPGHRPAAGVELVTHHHQQGLPSTGPTAVGWRRLKRHAQTQLTRVQQVQFVPAAINGEYARGELEVGEVFRERGRSDPCLPWCYAELSHRTRPLLRDKGPDNGTKVTLRQTGAEVLSTGPPPRTRSRTWTSADRHVRPAGHTAP